MEGVHRRLALIAQPPLKAQVAEPMVVARRAADGLVTDLAARVAAQEAEVATLAVAEVADIALQPYDVLRTKMEF